MGIRSEGMRKRVLFVFLFLLIFVTGLMAGGMMEDVEVEGVDLTEDTFVKVQDQDLLLKAGAPALFYSHEGVKTDHLYQGTIIEDAIFTVQGKEITVYGNNVVWFYESGNLKYTTAISEPTVFQVQGKDVEFYDQYDVYVPMGFHDNGSLHRGDLMEETAFELQGKSVKFKGMVVFSDAGQLLYGTLAEDAVIMVRDTPVEVPADKSVDFHENGMIREIGFLKEDTEFLVGDQIVKFTSNPATSSVITFYDNGSVIYGALAEDTIFTVGDREVLLKGRETARFYENGALAGGTPVDTIAVEVGEVSIQIKAGRGMDIGFYENGDLQSGVLAESTELEYRDRPFTVPKSSYVEFDEEGTLINFQTGS